MALAQPPPGPVRRIEVIANPHRGAPECLFVSIMGERTAGTLARFQKHEAKLQVLQIGGSETVGQGLCCCTFWHGGAA